MHDVLLAAAFTAVAALVLLAAAATYHRCCPVLLLLLTQLPSSSRSAWEMVRCLIPRLWLFVFYLLFCSNLNFTFGLLDKPLLWVQSLSHPVSTFISRAEGPAFPTLRGYLLIFAKMTFSRFRLVMIPRERKSLRARERTPQYSSLRPDLSKDDIYLTLALT